MVVAVSEPDNLGHIHPDLDSQVYESLHANVNGEVKAYHIRIRTLQLALKHT